MDTEPHGLQLGLQLSAIFLVNQRGSEVNGGLKPLQSFTGRQELATQRPAL